MKKKIRSFGILSAFCFIFVASLTSLCFAEDSYVLFLLDASGSMADPIEGKTKLDIAKESLSSALSEIPAEIPVGLRVYGHISDKSISLVENCRKATELIVPIEKGAKDLIKSKALSYSPKGNTPIALSLSKAPEDFPGVDAKRYIVLISDGVETCGGDPIAVIEDLKTKGFKVVIHTVGLDVDQKTRAQLQQIASAGGGMYLEAKNAAELGSSLKTITEDIRKKMVFATTAAQGQALQPGSNIETAPLITAGTKYEWDAFPEEMLFYKIRVDKGQSLGGLLQIKKKADDYGIYYLDLFDVDYVSLARSESGNYSPGETLVSIKMRFYNWQATEATDVYVRLKFKASTKGKIGYAYKAIVKSE